MAFGDVLRRLREAAGLTQASLAAKAGLSSRTIQGWEQGRRSPVSPDFFKLARALNVSCDEFAEDSTAENRAPRPRKSAAEKPEQKPAKKRKGK